LVKEGIPMKILVVDDSEFARHRIGKNLRDGGHEVIEAENGITALERAKNEQPDLVTVDLLMPGMDGIQLIRRLKSQYPAIRIIVLTADVQKATRQEALDAGADGFSAKTDSGESLLEIIRHTAEEKIPLVLTAAQKDAFTEMMNVSMGKAAEALSVLMARRVFLMVPEVELMPAPSLMAFFREEIVQVGVTIRQSFSGNISGIASMVFSESHALFLVRTLVGIQMELSRLSVADQSVLTEMGNVVLNAAIAVLADQCGGRLKISLPVVQMNQEGGAAARHLLDGSGGADNALVLVSRLTIGNAEIISYLIIFLSEKDVKQLLSGIC
jgi:CheY-like chemotaxis protein/CheY-specific phosphatase CheX